MNPIEQFIESIRRQLPSVELQLVRPKNADGVWAVDVVLGPKKLLVQWQEDHGFGLSEVSPDTYGEGPDEPASTVNEVVRRVREILEGDHRSTPRLSVLLARLRESCGLTQNELAARLGIRQSTMSGIERRPDVQLSTMYRVVRALGGRLEIVAVMGRHRYRLDANIDGKTARDSRALDSSPSGEFTTLISNGVLARAEGIAAEIRARGSVFEM